MHLVLSAVLSALAYVTFVISSTPIFPISPAYSNDTRDLLQGLRTSISVKHPPFGCGMVWVLAAINGSATDFSALERYLSGVNLFRMMSVAYEVLQSASKVKHALLLQPVIPSVCGGHIELALYTDRNELKSAVVNERNFSSDVACVFDRVVFFDELPLQDITSKLERNTGPSVQRLPPRANYMKILALLSTRYEYTLYLDGDTAPCKGFHAEIFQQLQEQDVLTSMNPFAHESTNRNPLYPAAPGHALYKSFAEPNGGVLGFRWNARTERWFVRALELVPYFHAMGFDQDQAYLRHALFEEVHLFGLKRSVLPMRKVCRFGWNCKLNNCEAGCLLIHQRICLINGVSANFSAVQPAATAQCARTPFNAVVETIRYHQQYQKARKRSKNARNSIK